MSESADLVHWEYRGVVFQPDAEDPPLLEIYLMPAFWYADSTPGSNGRCRNSAAALARIGFCGVLAAPALV